MTAICGSTNRASRRAISRSPASRPKSCWPCSNWSTTTIWRRRSRATLHWPARWTPEPGCSDQRQGPRPARTFPRSRSTAAPRARPGFVTGIGCRRPSSGRWLQPTPASDRSLELTCDDAIEVIEPKQASSGQRAAAIDLGFYRLQYGLWRPVPRPESRMVERAGLRPALGGRPGRAVPTGVHVGIRQGGRRIDQGRPPFPVPFRPLVSGKAELTIGGGGPEADGYHRTATTAIVGRRPALRSSSPMLTTS